MRTKWNLILKHLILLVTIDISSGQNGISQSTRNPFDLQPFLDPSVSLPIYTKANIASPNPQIGDGVNGDSRQLSLLPVVGSIQRRWFNTSCAFTIPLFTFTMPQQGAELSSVALANQAVFGLFGLLVTMMSIAIPVAFSGLRDPTVTGRSGDHSQLILDRLMSTRPVVDLMGADTKYRIGLDSTKCLLKTICEAHRSPDNGGYGVLALPFQLLFPSPSNSSELMGATSSLSLVQIAAQLGKYGGRECGQEYKCFFDVLDLATYFRDWFLSSTKDEGANELVNE